jgi:molybdate transport system regulatory protein
MNSYVLKIRVSNGETTAIGPGKLELLELINETGSISNAAKRMRMSYKRAWDLVMEMNKSFKQPLVIAKPGGWRGGGSSVTTFGLKVIESYRLLITKVKELDAYQNLTDLMQ